MVQNGLSGNFTILHSRSWQLCYHDILIPFYNQIKQLFFAEKASMPQRNELFRQRKQKIVQTSIFFGDLGFLTIVLTRLTQKSRPSRIAPTLQRSLARSVHASGQDRALLALRPLPAESTSFLKKIFIKKCRGSDSRVVIQSLGFSDRSNKWTLIESEWIRPSPLTVSSDLSAPG